MIVKPFWRHDNVKSNVCCYVIRTYLVVPELANELDVWTARQGQQHVQGGLLLNLRRPIQTIYSSLRAVYTITKNWFAVYRNRDSSDGID